MKNFKGTAFISVTLSLVLTLSGCAPSSDGVSLDPDNPITITVWHYFSGALLNSFDAMISDFNGTVGMEQGIIVEGVSFGSIGELDASVRASANQEVGSMELPNIFASFPDNAYIIQELGLLANLDDYFTVEQQQEYYPAFIERGRIGVDGELRIFPFAPATEIMMLNDTDWQPFADAYNLSYTDLQTMEGLAHVAQLYYSWSDGKAFFGRDAIANLFVIGSRQFGVEIFEVADRDVTINVDEEVMRKIWDHYYVPFISGYFSVFGRFRSDDVRAGDLLAYVGSTTSAVFFPEEVTIDGITRPIQPRILPPPLFEGANSVMASQGPGMVVTLATPEEQYASLIFLRWFTEPSQNLRFSALTAYLPVREVAMDATLVRAAADEAGVHLRPITEETISIALEAVKSSEMHATRAFDGAVAARAVLTNNLREMAAANREEILYLIENGVPREEAIARFSTEEEFTAWVTELREQLIEAVN